MLTEVQLTHFKAFRDLTRVPLRELTLLFGGNSAGKSSVFHAMHLAREVLTRGNLDPDRTELGGAGLDLGGFANLAYKHDLTRPVVLSFVLTGGDIAWDLPDEVFSVLDLLDDNEDLSLDRPPLAFSDGPARDLRVTIELRASSLREPVYVSAVELALGPSGPAAVRVERSSPTQIGATMTRFDSRQWRADPADPSKGHPLLLEALAMLQSRQGATGEGIPPDALGIPVMFVSVRWGLVGDFGQWRFAEGDDDEARLQKLVPWTLEAALGALVSELRKLLHVGPIRALPDRRFRAPRTPTPARWYSGLAAWDALLDAQPAFVALVNAWLSGDAGIDARVAVGVQELIELEPARLKEAIARAREQDFTALDALEQEARIQRSFVATDHERRVLVAPRDLGVGMSQVIPVVVAVLQVERRLVAVEQPELHVHPRVAVGLGDLFASQVTKNKQMIVETHSEHLLLRVLRRIRETSEGKAGEVALRPEQVSVVYFDAKDGVVEAVPLRVDRAGHFLDRWPHGFFEEQIREIAGDDGWPLEEDLPEEPAQG